MDPLILGVILLGGLYFSLTRGNLAFKGVVADSVLRAEAMVFPTLFALFAVNIMLKLFVG